MKKILPLLLIAISADASAADWERIDRAGDASSPKFIDTKTIRQTGPMNTMRRVWEVTNLSKPASNTARSIKNHVEYDCKDRRVRVLDESFFTEHFAQGDAVAAAASEANAGSWSEIATGGEREAIFKRVCPSDDS